MIMTTTDTSSVVPREKAAAILMELLADKPQYSPMEFSELLLSCREECEQAGIEPKVLYIAAMRALCELPGFERRFRAVCC